MGMVPEPFPKSVSSQQTQNQAVINRFVVLEGQRDLI